MSSLPRINRLEPWLVAVGLALSIGVGTGMILQPRITVALVAAAISATTCFLCHPLLMFALYYGICQFTAGVHVPGLRVSLSRALYLATLTAWMRWALTGRVMLPKGWAIWPTLFLAVYLTWSALTGYSHELGRTAAKTVITLCVISLAMASTLTSQIRIRQLFWIIIIPTCCNALVGMAEAAVNHNIYGVTHGFVHGLVRINGVSPNSIVFAHMCLFAFPFAVYLARHSERRWQRAAALAAGALLLAAALRTFNRQSMLLMPIMVVGCAVLFRGKIGKWLLIGTAAGILITGPLVIPAVLARLKTFGQLSTDASWRIRKDNMTNSMQLLKAYPKFGAGLGSFPDAWWHTRSLNTYYNQYEVTPRVQEVDMSYVRLLAETGYVGFTLNICYYLLMTIYVIVMHLTVRRLGIPHLRDFASLLLVAWFFFLLTSAMQDTALYLRTWFMMALTVYYAAIVQAAVRTRQSEQAL